MGKNIDRTFIQSKMLNKSKGPAVHSLRAQADKQNIPGVCAVFWKTRTIFHTAGGGNGDYHGGRADYGCQNVFWSRISLQSSILCTGTYLRARCIYGDVSTCTGPNGLQAANHLTESLKAHGISMYRFKTGTPARVDRRSLDFSKMEEQTGDERNRSVFIYHRSGKRADSTGFLLADVYQ